MPDEFSYDFGGFVNMVTKTGSNRYELDIGTFHEDSRLRPFLETADSNPLLTNTFFNPAVSGPIIKDKLWFYVGFSPTFGSSAGGVSDDLQPVIVATA